MSKDVFKKLDEAQSKWARVIADEVADRRFYDIKEVAAYAKVKLNMAIMDLVTIQVSDLEQQRSGLAAAYVDTTLSTHKRMEIASQLAEINHKKKSLNRLVHTMGDYDEFRQLKNYVSEKFGLDALHDFFDNYANKPENTANKMKHKVRLPNNQKQSA